MLSIAELAFKNKTCKGLQVCQAVANVVSVLKFVALFCAIIHVKETFIGFDRLGIMHEPLEGEQHDSK